MLYDATDEQWREYRVTPRYLAGSDGTGDAGFAPVAHWPHHYLDEGPCQLLVSSPDQRIRIGWFGDDFELWKITAAEDAASGPHWSATFNHVTPGEIVAGLTTALEHDYDAGDHRFLARPSMYWTDAVKPLTDAGWIRRAPERGTVEIIAPDGQAGALVDTTLSSRGDKTIMLWAGPPGWGTRAEAVFTSRTPSHLIAASAAAMTDPTPVIRERHAIHPAVEHLVTLTPVHPPAPAAPRAPTPLDVRRTAVTQAVHRAARNPRTAADLRVQAARSRTAAPAPNRADGPRNTPVSTPPASLPAPAHRR
ncbi:DUF317 domain-containing protein [Streptomyces polygonati]|uniref:DUF317 domain-containing protein n=1 Tax=Streptomyces polygonati TaxID=1617087 RepID=A0ABV8HT35_9ACTN